MTFPKALISHLLLILLYSDFSKASTNFVITTHISWDAPSSGFRKNEEKLRVYPGDSVVIEYDNKTDSLLEVTKEHYEECDRTNPIKSYHDGKTKITFEEKGWYFFISGAVGLCERGERVAIKVMKAKHHRPPPPPPAPTPSPHAAPVPAPAPSPSEVPVPAPAPSPSEVPIPAPAPSPSEVPIPAPAPSPSEIPVPAPSPSDIPVPAPTPSGIPVPAPSPSEIPIPAPTPSEIPVPAPAPSPSEIPVPAPAPSPSEIPTPAPGPSPSGPVLEEGDSGLHAGFHSSLF